jgi:hypothetical protein
VNDAVEKRLFARALIEYGRVFELLMTAIQFQRKQQQQRPKKGSHPAINAVTGPETPPGKPKANR